MVKPDASKTVPIGHQHNTGASADALSQADGLLEQALAAAAEQTFGVFRDELTQRYKAAMAQYAEAKRDQADRIEDRLENLIEVQTGRLQAVQNRPPGFLTPPGRRVKWQQQIQRQQAIIEQLHARLEIVREIRDGMDMHGSRIEAIANRKLRGDQPELAKEWDAMLTVLRQNAEFERVKDRMAQRDWPIAGRGRHLKRDQEG